MGARICGRCSTRVDERRAKDSPFCLSCGAPLGAPSPTFSGKKAGGGSALPWILGGIGAVVLLGVGGVVVLIAAVAEDDPAPAAVVEAGAAAPKVEVSDASVAVVSPSAKPTAKPPQPTAATAPTRSPTASPFPTPTLSPTPTPTPTPPLPLGAFPRTKAINELDRVTASLASCKSAGDPSGAGTIRVDFEPDGRVGTLSRKPFAGTPTGSCISARFLAIRIGAFNGTTQQIERTFTMP